MPGSIPACSSIIAWMFGADITLSSQPVRAPLGHHDAVRRICRLQRLSRREQVPGHHVESGGYRLRPDRAHFAESAHHGYSQGTGLRGVLNAQTSDCSHSPTRFN